MAILFAILMVSVGIPGRDSSKITTGEKQCFKNKE